MRVRSLSHVLLRVASHPRHLSVGQFLVNLRFGGDIMGIPFHVSESISESRFLQTKASAEYEALSTIAESLPNPERTLLSAFVQEALNREVAARFLLDKIFEKNKAALTEFLATWISLLERGMLLIPQQNAAEIFRQCALLLARTWSSR